MAITLNYWYKLGKKTFWLFLFHSAKFFIFFLAGSILFTYHAMWGKWQESFKNFFEVKHANWYLTPESIMMILWLSILGYLIVVLLRAWVIYRQYKFMLNENAFHVRKGIFFIKEIVIPYHQIQNVEIQQPYFYRPFGFAELDILTITDSGFSNKDRKGQKKLLPVIDKRIAKILAYELVNRGSSRKQAFVTDESEEESETQETASPKKNIKF